MIFTSPGRPNHISAEPITSIAPNAAIHGLRRPLASAIAPRTGDSNAIAMPAAAVAKPQSACPLAASGATCVAKYGAKTKVVISVKVGLRGPIKENPAYDRRTRGIGRSNGNVIHLRCGHKKVLRNHADAFCHFDPTLYSMMATVD